MVSHPPGTPQVGTSLKVATSATLALGQSAPDFELKNQHGQDVRLSALRGERLVVLMFFPFAFSTTCRAELREADQALPALQRSGVELLAISCDPMYALRVFADGEGLRCSMLSDFWPHGEVARQYAVFDDKRGCALRGTFVIDRSGVLRWKAENEMADARDWATVRQALAELGS